MLPIVIVNPHSAGGSTRENWASIAADLRAHFGPFKTALTRAPGDGVRLAREAAASGTGFIIACGGDGTINEVANGIIDSGTDAELGVLPSGTGGDLRRTLGIPSEHRGAAKALREGRTMRMDAGKVRFADHHGTSISRHFLNVSSVGLAASIIRRVKSNKALAWLPLGSVRGRANFALSTLREVVDLEPLLLRVSIDGGDEHSLQTLNFCIANARYFGGGMKIAPDAKINDGRLDVVNIGDIGTARIFLNGYSLYNGTHLDLPEVKSTLARRIDIRAASGADVHLETDGELPGKLPATYEIVPSALRVRIAATERDP